MSTTDDGGGNGGKLVQMRDYARTMHQRIQSLRDRARSGPSNAAMEEAFEELEVTREELTVANEEISRTAAALEEARQRSEAMLRHYRELFDGAPDGYALTDAYGTLREGNRTLATMLGVHPQFLSRKPLVSFVVRGDVREFRGVLAELGHGTRDGDPFRVTLRPRHKQPPFIAEIVPRVVRGVGGHITSVRWAVRSQKV